MALNIHFQEADITVPFAEFHGSPTFNRTNNRFTGNRVLKCAFNQAELLSEQLVGGPVPGRDPITYNIPHRFPLFRNAVAKTVSMDPFGGQLSPNAENADYPAAKVTVGYEVPDGENEPSFSNTDVDPESVLITERLEPNAEFITRSPEGFFWAINGVAGATKTIKLTNQDVPGNPVLLMDWVYTFHGLTFIPSETLDLINTVNSKDVRSRRLLQEAGNFAGFTSPFIFKSETLLFNAPFLERQITTLGTEAWRITYRMTWREKGWNKFFRSGELEPQKIKHVDSPLANKDHDFFKLADFSQIISADFES